MKKSSSWSARGVAVAVVAVLGLGLLAGTTHAEQRVYWCQGLEGIGAGSFLKRMNLDGAALDTFADTGCIAHVAADPFWTRQLFFIAAPDVSLIHRASLDTGAVSGWIGFAGNTAAGIALDLGTNGPVYFGYNAGGTGTIWRANIDATNITFILATATFIRDLALDPIGNRLYWVETDGIHRAIQTGSSPELIVADGNINSVAVDNSGGRVYWVDNFSQRVRRANLDGTGIQTLWNSTRPTKSIRLDGLGKMYWYEFSASNGGRIRRASISGTGTETLVDLGGGFDNTTEFIGLEVGFFRCGRNSPFGDVDFNGSLSFGDISRAVDCFRAVASCSNADFNRADLNPCNSGGCTGDGLVNFTDVSRAVDAFRGLGCI